MDNLESPLVITYDNKPTKNTRNFLYTLNRNKWDYVLIGEGETWEGFISKMRGYKKYLETLNPKKIVVISDSRDVFCLRCPKSFLKKVRGIKQPMIVSMEIFCEGMIFPKEDYKGTQCVLLNDYYKHHGIDSSVNLRKFVNSGLICGEAGVVLEYFNYAIDNKFEDDQLALGMFMNLYPEKIFADIHANLLHNSVFGCNAGILHIELQKHDSPTIAEFCGRSSFFLHIPGIHSIKGQENVYNMVWKIIGPGLSDELLREGYDCEEP